MKDNYVTYTKKIELLNIAELRASNPVMKKMWHMKSWDLFQKRTEWLNNKCRSLQRIKND